MMTADSHVDAIVIGAGVSGLIAARTVQANEARVLVLDKGRGVGDFTLRVVNTVENLDERDLPHLFERFWRKDAARSPDGHTGLGLSIACVFARSLDCELTASFVGPARLALILAPITPKTTNQRA